MIVVADASPVNYLIQLECVEILEQLYGRVLVPQAVMRELRDERAPASVNRWSSTLPSCAEVGHLAAGAMGLLGPRTVLAGSLRRRIFEYLPQ